jgi:single-strand DNA-binding protein
MNELTITIAGNLVDDPQLRFTTAGQTVALLRIASMSRRRDRTSNWADGNTIRRGAEGVALPATDAVECLAKGDRVVVTGRIAPTYTPRRRPSARGPYNSLSSMQSETNSETNS